jgi:hypothetical protein
MTRYCSEDSPPINVVLLLTNFDSVCLQDPFLPTGGGTTLIITGDRFGPARADVVPILAAVTVDLIGQWNASETYPYLRGTTGSLVAADVLT